MMASDQKNQGEGNREAAREYNEDQQKFVRDSDRVKRKVEDAERAVEGKERAELERAEREGKKHAKDEDPEITRPGYRSTEK
jgi:hypothetical protein